MARKEIGNPLDRENRNNHNDNYKELFKEIGVVDKRIDGMIDEISDQAFDKVIDNSKLNWKEPVNNFNSLPSSAQNGDTRMDRSTGKVYRYDGSEWKEIQQIDAGPVNELDSRLTSQLNETDQELLNKADIVYVETLKNAIGGGSPKGVFNTLSDLINKYPNGTEGIYIVKEDGYWYYWDDAEWKKGDIYQNEVESDFPARNLIKNSIFNGRTNWQISAGLSTETANQKLIVESDGTVKVMRVTQSNTGLIPKKGDKIFSAIRVNVLDDTVITGRLNLRDWTTGGTYHDYIEFNPYKINQPQDIVLYSEVDENFKDELRYYVELDIKTNSIGKQFEISRPMILNLTDIFGVGNEPNEEVIIRLLKKFGGWFEGEVTEFFTKGESKVLSSISEKKSNTSFNKIEAITKGYSLTFENKIKNGNFFNTDFIGGNNWNRVGITNTSAKDNEASFIASGQNQTLSQVVQAKKNHIYYVWAQVKSTSDLVSLMVSGNLNASKAHTGSGEYEFLSCRHIRDNDAGVNIEIRDRRSSGWDKVFVKYVGVVDLTEVFGEGNEPEIYEFDKFMKRLINMWFDGKKHDVMDFEEVYNHFEKTKTRKLEIAERAADKPKKYFRSNPPKLVMTMTYDDECSSIYDLAKPIHESENVPATFYVIPSRIGTRQVFNYGVAEEWIRLIEMNNEGLITIQHHTYAHYVVNNSSEDYLRWMIKRSQEMFWRNGIFPKHLAYPGGAHDYNAINVLQDYVETATTTSPVVNGYDLNPYRIHRLGLDERTVEQAKAFIDNAVQQGGWLLTYQHSLSETGVSLGGYVVRKPSEQLEIIQYAKSKGVEFVSLEEGLEMYKPYEYITDPSNIDNALYSLQRNGIVNG